MDHVLEEEKDKYFMDVLGRAAEMSEEGSNPKARADDDDFSEQR